MTVLQPLAAVPSSRSTATVRVHASTATKPVDRAASGSLYGLADEQHPPQRLLDDLRPASFTQMAPGGQQVPNGEPGPSGDALLVASRAASVGARLIVRLADSYPDFPYRWVSWPDWLDRVGAAVSAVASSGTGNVGAFELWNEPNWTWDAQAAGDFHAGWTRTWQAVRAADPRARVLGPSIDRWDVRYMHDFLRAATADGTAPDVVSWHELDPADTDVVAHVAQYRALERDLGLEPRPVSVNEYGAHRDMAVPSRLAGWVARLERAGVDSANLAFWHRPGRLADLVTADGEPTGGWWVYRWYAQMSGQMLAVRPAPDADAFAARSDAGVVDVVVTGTGGTVVLEVDELDGTPAVHVEVDATRWTGTDGPLRQPERWFEATVRVVGGRMVLPLQGTDELGAYRVRIRPTTAPVPSSRTDGVQPGTQARPARLWAAEVRRHGRLGRDDGTPGWVLPGPEGGWRLVVPAEALPATGLDVRVHCRRLSDEPGTVTVAAGGEPIELAVATVGDEDTLCCTLAAAPGSDLVVESRGPAVAVEHLEVRAFHRRLEAEDGRIVRGSVFVADPSPASFRSLTFSGRGQVEHLDEIGSSVALGVDLPCDGDYLVTVGYSNGGGATTQALLIDGTPAGHLRLPATQGWGLIGTAQTRVRLTAGRHELTIRRIARDGHVTLDYVDVDLQAAPPVEAATGVQERR